MGSIYAHFADLKQKLNHTIIGQSNLIDKLLVTVLSDGHLLVEGAPGLAKTKVVKTLSGLIEGDFHRIQFTPDLLPADLTGTEIYKPQQGHFTFQKGPLFHNILLADEINRAPAKVQSALLEAMAERQITIGQTSYRLSEPFLVMATQNSIEQEGTYPLPAAQLDRFLMHVLIDYPNSDSEYQILKSAQKEQNRQHLDLSEPLISRQMLFDARKEVLNTYIAESLENYIIQLIMATRFPEHYDNQLASQIRFGASPRATIALDRCAKAYAWLNEKDFVSPEDIHAVIYEILRHRILISFEAEAEGKTTTHIIKQLLNVVSVP